MKLCLGDEIVLDVFECLIPMVLAAIFVWTAVMFFGIGMKQKEDRKVTMIGAILIELVSFTIWIPNLSELFSIIGFAENVKQILMAISIALILLATAVAILFEMKQKT